MALEIRIDTNAANAAVAELRKNITALGGDTKLSAAEIQKLEERLRKQMGADAATDALRKLQQQTGMTDAVDVLSKARNLILTTRNLGLPQIVRQIESTKITPIIKSSKIDSFYSPTLNFLYTPVQVYTYSKYLRQSF